MCLPSIAGSLLSRPGRIPQLEGIVLVWVTRIEPPFSGARSPRRRVTRGVLGAWSGHTLSRGSRRAGRRIRTVPTPSRRHDPPLAVFRDAFPPSATSRVFPATLVSSCGSRSSMANYAAHAVARCTPSDVHEKQRFSSASRRTAGPADSSESIGFRDTRTRRVLGTLTNTPRETVALTRSRGSRSGLRSHRGLAQRRHDGRPATMRPRRASKRWAGDGSGPVYCADSGASPTGTPRCGPRAALGSGV